MSLKTKLKITTLPNMRTVTEGARKEFSRRLKEWREREDYTQQRLSEELPTSLSSVAKWELCISFPGNRMVRKRLMEVTGIDVDNIVKEFSTGGERAQNRN